MKVPLLPKKEPWFWGASITEDEVVSGAAVIIPEEEEEKET